MKLVVFERTRIEYRERGGMYKVYRRQSAVVRIEGQEKKAEIKKGARQGCSHAFLTYTENRRRRKVNRNMRK